MFKEFNELIGKTITRIETSNEVYSNELSEINDIVHGNRQIWFYMDDGSKFHMYHDQMCCEDVCVEDVCGDVKCLIGSPITQAEICNEATMSYDDDVCGFKHGGPYWSWTFYKFATAKGYVTIRWYGESNGCYSCEVMTEYTNPNDDILFKYELNPWGDDDES